MSVYQSTITVTQNDYGYDLEGKIVDADGTAVDLTSCSLKLLVWKPGTATPKISAVATLSTPPPYGLWKYTVKDKDFDEGDVTYSVEIEITKTNVVVTAYGGTIYVRAEAPEA